VDVQIQRLDPKDSAVLAEVVWRSVREAALHYYTTAQVQAWLPEKPSAEAVIDRVSDGRTTLVARDPDQQIVGYIDLEPNGHIDHLFCVPEAIGTGVASKLYDELERLALAREIPRLYVEASEGARRLFERSGFIVEARRDFPLNGVLIHNYAMSKILRASASC
jgi:putative acetyltransferase